MKKLINGIIDFRSRVLPKCRDKFAELSKGQFPDALFVSCSDSRVAPNWFASTDPGDLFVIRNVGNMIPPCGSKGITENDVSELAAVEFALKNLNVRDLVVCGHSDCGAMIALETARDLSEMPHLKSWLKNAHESYSRFRRGEVLDKNLSPANQLSQINVLQQIEHLKSYPVVAERLAHGRLNIHGWWFDIASAGVHSYDDKSKQFKLIS